MLNAYRLWSMVTLLFTARLLLCLYSALHARHQVFLARKTKRRRVVWSIPVLSTMCSLRVLSYLAGTEPDGADDPAVGTDE